MYILLGGGGCDDDDDDDDCVYILLRTRSCERVTEIIMRGCCGVLMMISGDTSSRKSLYQQQKG